MGFTSRVFAWRGKGGWSPPVEAERMSAQLSVASNVFTLCHRDEIELSQGSARMRMLVL